MFGLIGSVAPPLATVLSSASKLFSRPHSESFESTPESHGVEAKRATLRASSSGSTSTSDSAVTDSTATASILAEDSRVVDRDPESIFPLSSFANEQCRSMELAGALSKENKQSSTEDVVDPTTSLFLNNVKRDEGIPYAGGSWSDVYIGSYKNSKVAVKALRIFAPKDGREHIFKELFKQAKVWIALEHPHIVPLLGISQDLFERRVCLVSPFMENGNIKQYIEKTPRDVVNPLQLMSDVAEGLKYLHSHNFVHGDIKAANILINDDKRALLADMGLAAISTCEAFVSTRQVSMTGTARWMAPELFDDKPTLSFSSDIYAFGMTLYEVLTGKFPFHEYREILVINMIINGKRPPRQIENSLFILDDTVWQLIDACWQEVPIDRSSVQEVASQLSKLAALCIDPNRMRL